MAEYDSNSMNCRLLDMETKEITVLRHIVFHEEVTEKGKPKKFWPMMDMPVSTTEDDDKISSEVIENNETTEEDLEEYEEQRQTVRELHDRSQIRIPTR